MIKTLFKIVLAVILVLVLLMVAAALVLRFAVNPNTYKTKITAWVLAETGRTLSIQGPITWSLYPNLAITLQDVSLSNPKGMPGPDFLQAQAVRASIAVRPLLARQIVVNGIEVDHLQLHLLQVSPSVNNWTFAPMGASVPTASVTAPQTPAPKPVALPIAIHQFTLNDARIGYRNQQTHQWVEWTDVNVIAHAVSLTQPFPVRLSFRINSNAPQVAALVNLDTSLLVDPAQQRYALNGYHLSADGTVQAGQASTIPLQIASSGTIAFEQVAEQLHWQLSASINGAAVSTAGTVKHLQTQPTYQGTLQLAPFNLASWLQSLHQTVPKLPNPQALNPLALSTHFAGEDHQLALTELSATLYQSHFSGAINLKAFNHPDFSADIAMDVVNIANYADLKGAGLTLHQGVLKAELASTHWSAPELIQQLQGRVQLTAQPVVLAGVDVGALLQQVNQTLESLQSGGDWLAGLAHIQQALPHFSEGRINADNGQQTVLKSVQAITTIHQGLVQQQVLELLGDHWQMVGQGSANLNTQTLAYRLTANTFTVQTNAAGQTGQVPGPLQVPIIIQGPFSHIQTSLDTDSLVGQIQTIILKQLKATAVQSAAGGGSDQPMNALQQQAQALLAGVFH